MRSGYRREVARSRRKLDRAAFEREIGDRAEEYRCELRVRQITPIWGTAREAFVLVRPGSEGAVGAIRERFASSALGGFFHLMTSAELETSWRGSDGAASEPVPPGRLFIRLAHDSDRTYAGYENIYRVIREFASHGEDCRFVISEDYSSWVDEYRIVAGDLVFERGVAEGDSISQLLDYFEREAQQRPDDAAWVRFAARELAQWAAYHLGTAEQPTRDADEREEGRSEGRGLLDRAVVLDEGEAVVCAQMGRLLLLEGHREAAQKWLERHAELTVAPDMLFTSALASLTSREHENARKWIRRLLDVDPNHQAAHQLLAILAHREGALDDANTHARAAFRLAVATQAAGRPHAPAAEQLHRGGIHSELLEVYLAALQPASEAERVASASELLRWAELFRIKMCHGIDKPESTQLAMHYYERAIATHPLDGRIHAGYALFCRQANRPGSDALLRAALELNPDHIESLGALGASALEARRFTEAIELLDRAVERSLATKTGSYRRGVDANRLISAYLDEGNRLLDLRGEANLEAADGFFVGGLQVVERLDFDRSEWFALILRRSAAHTLLGRHEQALAFAEQALDLRSDSVHAMSEVASCLHNLGRHGDALAAIELAAELDEGYWHVPYVRACILAKTSGALAEIVALLRRAIELDPSCRALIIGDPDFESIRDRAEFRAL